MYNKAVFVSREITSHTRRSDFLNKDLSSPGAHLETCPLTHIIRFLNTMCSGCFTTGMLSLLAKPMSPQGAAVISLPCDIFLGLSRANIKYLQHLAGTILKDTLDRVQFAWMWCLRHSDFSEGISIPAS